MYFTAEAQAQMLRRFHFGLDDDGVLLLGKSEMLITQSELFTPIDLKRRVFRKVLRPSARGRVRTLAIDPGNGASQSIADNLREAAFNIGGGAQLVLDASGVLVMANELGRRMFGLVSGDFGRPLKDLEVSYRPVELRSHLDKLAAELRSLEVKSVPWLSGEEERVLDVRLVPLVSDGALMGTSISYLDVTESHRLHEQLQASKRELEQAYEELQATVEELETTNEELQSTNEELETTNEELQSTNEELETMNEELQSSNEELETMNEELRHRSTELHQLNAFLETILSTMGLAVAVLDQELRVQIWNGQARELWGLAPEEVEDQNVLALDIGLPVERLKPAARAVLGGSEQEEMVVEATNRRGRAFQCRVTLLPLRSGRDGAVSGVIVKMASDGG
jgi:two-component system CheB/CheR fusion protein